MDDCNYRAFFAEGQLKLLNILRHLSRCSYLNYPAWLLSRTIFAAPLQKTGMESTFSSIPSGKKDLSLSIATTKRFLAIKDTISLPLIPTEMKPRICICQGSENVIMEVTFRGWSSLSLAWPGCSSLKLEYLMKRNWLHLVTPKLLDLVSDMIIDRRRQKAWREGKMIVFQTDQLWGSLYLNTHTLTGTRTYMCT